MPRLLQLLCLGVVCVFLLGCNSSTITVLPVTGVVTLDGQPLEQAIVTFYPTSGQPLPAGGHTDSAGKFTLKTIEGPHERIGALPGSYKVVVVKTKALTGRKSDDPGLSSELGPYDMKLEWITPEKYADHATTELTCEVSAGMTPPQFDLKSK
jgi:hypothetical protein